MIHFNLPFFNKIQIMSVYQYVAENNPMVAEGIMDSFGYTIANTPDMGLSQLVAKVGEPALKKVMDNHPDKEIILEMFGNESSDKTSSCGCASCTQKKENYLNATGDTTTNTQTPKQDTMSNQTGLFLFFGAVMFSLALIYKNK
jgi:hypothetical protein